jgi:hypothetical protein
LGWFVPLIGQLVDFAAQHNPTFRPRRRPLAQPHKHFQGSIADRKMDVGFIDDPHADVDARYR